MTTSRIAFTLLAPALASILAIACSSSDNNGGGTTVGGNGGSGGSGTANKGGSGPAVVTGDADCLKAYENSVKCGEKDDGKEAALAECKKFSAACIKCIGAAECDKRADCAADCVPTGGNGDAGTGGTGGGTSGKGGTGGGGTTDPEECLTNCDAENPDGADALNSAFVEKCGCTAGAACADECGASCAAKQVDQACGTCLNGLGQGDACVNEVITACQADKDCASTISCYAGCQDTGSGGSGGGSGGQACANECAKNNQAGVAKYNADAQNQTKCLCEGAECKDICGESPICTTGKPEATKECIDCQDKCFGTCLADAACKELFECIQGCSP